MGLSVPLGARFWAGVILGAFTGWGSESLTRLALQGLFLRKASLLRPLASWLSVGFYLVKQAALWLLLYWVLSSLHLSLLGFAGGVLAYQLYRLSLMIFWPRVYLGQG